MWLILRDRFFIYGYLYVCKKILQNNVEYFLMLLLMWGTESLRVSTDFSTFLISKRVNL